MKLLITGATGFIGHCLLQRLLTVAHYTPIAAVRRGSISPEGFRAVTVGDLLPDTDWSQTLRSIDVVIHLAARVHVMQDTATDPLAAFRITNTESTLNFARQAAAAGVRRFIYLSSIKVNGEYTTVGKPFTANDTHIPTDPYSISKYEAEQGLRELAEQTGMELVIIRPPLVYGPGVKANFLSMMRWLHKGIPLPLGAIHNQRSLVALENLVDLISTCIDHTAAANQTFLVSDGDDLSTTALLQCMGKALGKPSRLIPVHSSILTAGAAFLGKKEVARRLCSSLQVDMRHTKNTLDWKPPVSVHEALKKTADDFLRKCNKR